MFICAATTEDILEIRDNLECATDKATSIRLSDIIYESITNENISFEFSVYNTIEKTLKGNR